MENLIFYLLGFGVLLLILISTIQILISKKISWQKNPFDSLILLFLMAVALSTLFSSPNKIQALLNPNFGLVMMVFLTILYFYVSRFVDQFKGDHKGSPLQIISIILSLITIVFYFHPFKNISPNFTPVGSQLDLAILLGFFVILGIVSFPRRRESSDFGSVPAKAGIRSGMTLVINLFALFLTVYSLVKPNPGLINQTPTLILPPFRLSWFAALEILKNPWAAIIGVGPDNFSAIFTHVKDFAYNQSTLWQVDSFNVSHSAILQILTETGIFGLLTFGLLVFNVCKLAMKQWSNGTMKQFICLFIYLIICLLIFPTSFIVWFLFFVVLGLVSQQSNNETMKQSTDLSNLMPIYIVIIIISLGLIGASGYFLGRSYASEYYFKKSLNGIVNNNLKDIYDNQRQAIILNPYIERFRSSFAQTNLVIANNIANKTQLTTTESAQRTQRSAQLTEQDRQTITQAIQAGIAEGKAAVSLNPQKAGNWQNLASIYLNVINTAKGADGWTISAYQRAILADPQNPTYRVGLGGVYYNLKKYNEALRFFEQAVSLKPDWANANYNYAWANFQIKNYPQAVNAMENALKLINPKTNKTDYEKVKKELEDFKKMLSI